MSQRDYPVETPDWSKDKDLLRVVAICVEGLLRTRPTMSFENLLTGGERRPRLRVYTNLESRDLQSERDEAAIIVRAAKRGESHFRFSKFANHPGWQEWAWQEWAWHFYPQSFVEEKASTIFTAPYRVDRVSNLAIDLAKRLIEKAQKAQ